MPWRMDNQTGEPLLLMKHHNKGHHLNCDILLVLAARLCTLVPALAAGLCGELHSRREELCQISKTLCQYFTTA